MSAFAVGIGDLAILAFEVFGKDLPLGVVQDLMFAFGRAYPPGWMEDGSPFHCTKTSWLGKDGRVLASSDFEGREKFLASVCRHRAPAIAAHWEFLLAPHISAFGGKAECKKPHAANPAAIRMVADADVMPMSAKGQKRTWCSPDELFCYSWDTIKRPKNASPDANKPTAAPA